MTKFLRFQKKNDPKSKNLTAKIQQMVPLPPRLITEDFLLLAQKKNNIIEKITQMRATEIGRLNTYEEIENENLNSEVKISSTEKNSKKSEEKTDSRKSHEHSFRALKQQEDGKRGKK